MKYILWIAAFLAAIPPAAEATPVEDALVSNTWHVQIDERPPTEVRFLSDGTAKSGKAVWHWTATGPQTFTINGNNDCTFYESLGSFTGHWTNKKGDHTMTATRLTPDSQPSADAPPSQAAANPSATPFVNPLDRPAYDQHTIWTNGNYYYLGRYYGWRYWYQGRYYYSSSAPTAASSAARAQQPAAPGSSPGNPLDRSAYDQRYIWTPGSYYYLGRYYGWRYWYQGRYYYSSAAPAASSYNAPAQSAAAPSNTPANPLDRSSY